MSIIIVGVGQAEFDGEFTTPAPPTPNPPPPMLPRLQAPGRGPAPQSEAHTWVCDQLGQLAAAGVCLHRGLCVRVCAPHPHPKAVERRPMTPPSSHPGSLGVGSWRLGWNLGLTGWASL